MASLDQYLISVSHQNPLPKLQQFIGGSCAVEPFEEIFAEYCIPQLVESEHVYTMYPRLEFEDGFFSPRALARWNDPVHWTPPIHQATLPLAKPRQRRV